jgi:8-oxo-dGTP diphosphatase
MRDRMERPGVGVSCIIIKGSRVLLGKRKGVRGAGTWAFPGGHLELYEEPEDAAAREAFEETSVKVSLPRFAAMTNDIFREDKRHYITLHFVCSYKSGEPKITEPEKCEGWEWFKCDELPEPLFPSVKKLTEQKFNPFSPSFRA